MSRTETENTAFWDALSDEEKQAFIAHAWRVVEYRDREHSNGIDTATKPYMDALKDYCEVRTGDTQLGNILSAADTLKHVPQHAGSVYDTLPKNIRQANAIYHAAIAEAEQHLLPYDAFLMHDPAHAKRTEAGTSLMDVKNQLVAFKAEQGTKSTHILGALVVRTAVQNILDTLDEMIKLTQPGPPEVTLAKLDRRLLAGYCNTLQTPEIAAQHPELEAPISALSELLKLHEVQKQVQAEKSQKAFYRR